MPCALRDSGLGSGRCERQRSSLAAAPANSYISAYLPNVERVTI
ncbi:hypothetical protein SAMCCGM7_pC1449 (plasmid) [Sinorhizobium americanum CCGM7]|nr:hypothetical protein SAMCCGM7_pC1449 [Sinorhizobium americanum CCGM7]